MTSKILITGPPRGGKSTLIKGLVKYLYQTQSFKIQGFLTPEVREHNKRIGFDIEDISSGRIIPLARIGNIPSKNKLGRYRVFTEKLDSYILSLDKNHKNHESAYIIDEIGKMELFSERFEDFVKKLFVSENNVIATIGQKINHPIEIFLKDLPNLHLFALSIENQQEIFKKIISFFL